MAGAALCCISDSILTANGPFIGWLDEDASRSSAAAKFSIALGGEPNRCGEVTAEDSVTVVTR